MVAIHLPKDQALAKLRAALGEVDNLKSVGAVHDPRFEQWRRNTRVTISAVFGPEASHLYEWSGSSFSPYGAFNSSTVLQAFARGMEATRALLQSMVQEVEQYGEYPGNRDRDRQLEHAILSELDGQRRGAPERQQYSARIDVDQLCARVGASRNEYLAVAHRLLDQGKIAEHTIQQHELADGYAFITEAGVQALQADGGLPRDAGAATQAAQYHVLDFRCVRSGPHRTVVSADYRDAQRAFLAEIYKAAALLAGGVVEAMLLDALQWPETTGHPQYAQAMKALPMRGSQVNWDRASLERLVGAAVAVDLLDTTGQHMALGARDFRDTVHPNAEVRLARRAQREDAEVLLAVVRWVHAELSQKSQALLASPAQPPP